MADKNQEPEEWLLLSTCIARMGELHPAYRSRLGHARRDFEAALRAGRGSLRGRRPGRSVCLPEPISGPITSRHRLNLIYNTFSERRPGPFGDNVLFRDVESDWNKIKDYLREFANECWPSGEETVEPQRPNSKVSLSVPRARALTKEYIEQAKRNGHQPTSVGLENFVRDRGFSGNRELLRQEFRLIQNAAGTPVRRGRIKKTPS